MNNSFNNSNSKRRRQFLSLSSTPWLLLVVVVLATQTEAFSITTKRHSIALSVSSLSSSSSLRTFHTVLTATDSDDSDGDNNKNEESSPTSSSSSSSSSPRHVVLFGVGDLRVDDHEGLQRALTQANNNNHQNIWPLVVLDAAHVRRIPGGRAHTGDTLELVSYALVELYQELYDKYQLELQVVWVDNNNDNNNDNSVLSTTASLQTLLDRLSSSDQANEASSTTSYVCHVCDVGPADAQMGYHVGSTLLYSSSSDIDNDNDDSSLLLQPWQCILRPEPWDHITTNKNDASSSSSFASTEFPDYQRRYLRNRPPVSPLQDWSPPNESVQDKETNEPIKDLSLTVTMAPPPLTLHVVSDSCSTTTSYSSTTEWIQHLQALFKRAFMTQDNNNDKNTAEEALWEANRGSGLYGTHWGGVSAPETIGCQSATRILQAYTRECRQDDDAWFQSPDFPQPYPNPQSLEHATMQWQLQGPDKNKNQDDQEEENSPKAVAQNWMPGEAMTRFLAAPLLLGTISPRRVWHEAARAVDTNDVYYPWTWIGGNDDKLAWQPLQQMVETREWHQLLAAHNIMEQPDEYTAAAGSSSSYQYRYWRYHGFLSRYVAHSLQAEDKKNTQETVSSSSSSSSWNDGLLLVHGFGASGAQWLKTLDALAENNKDDQVFTAGAMAPDLLGFGASEKPGLSYTGYLWDSCILDFVKEHCDHWQSFVVGGNSIGGFTSMSVAASDTAAALLSEQYVLSSTGAAGTGKCTGLVLMNSAGPILTPPEVDAAVQELQQKGAPVVSTAERTATNGLPRCQPPWRPLGRVFGQVLLAYLRPRIQSICVNLYPTNPDAVDDNLCENIKRDSLDPGAIYVMMAGAKLPQPRSANELLAGDFACVDPNRDATSLIQEAVFDGPVLIAQGVLDPLNDAQDRMERFAALRAGITADPLQAGHCPHDELPEEMAQRIARWATTTQPERQQRIIEQQQQQQQSTPTNTAAVSS